MRVIVATCHYTFGFFLFFFYSFHIAGSYVIFLHSDFSRKSFYTNFEGLQVEKRFVHCGNQKHLIYFVENARTYATPTSTGSKNVMKTGFLCVAVGFFALFCKMTY